MTMGQIDPDYSSLSNNHEGCNKHEGWKNL